jgi:rhomboid protease GluP
MNEERLNPLEAILRMCAAAAPGPWYPRAYAKSTGVPWEGMVYYLEHLWLDGLIVRAEGSDATGPGITLSDKGRGVLDDPEALQRLRAGEPVVEGDRGGIVRQALRSSSQAVVSRVLLFANLLVFGYGMSLVWSAGKLTPFLKGFGAAGDVTVHNALVKSGAVTPALLMEGQWWRLLTNCFVHIGALHLAMNMYMLHAAGKYIERMWGPVRYLVIYLVAGLGGSCLAMAKLPPELPPEAAAHFVLAGASGALCGLIGAEAVWVILNGRYLPRSLLGRWRGNLLTQALLIVFISLFPQVSGWGHLGGAVAGAAVAVLLHVHRFWGAPWRWLALAALVPLVYLEFYVLQRGRADNPVWKGAAKKEFERESLPAVRETLDKAVSVYEVTVKPGPQFLHPIRRDPAEVEKVLGVIAEQRAALAALADRLNQSDPSSNELAEKAVQYTRETERLFELSERCLRAGRDWTQAQERELNKQEKAVLDLQREWKKPPK